jgi:hypothetical protein
MHVERLVIEIIQWAPPAAHSVPLKTCPGDTESG